MIEMHLLRLIAHGNVFDRFHVRPHAKTVSYTVNLQQKSTLIQHSEHFFPLDRVYWVS